MALTKFDLISKAMTLLDADEVDSWGSSNPSREEEVSQQLYDLAKKTELVKFSWNFNTDTFVLSQETGTPVDTNWTYKHLEPSDSLLIVNIIDANGNGVDYKNENGKIYSNTQIIKAKYRKDIDENLMPFFFVDVLVARLAVDFAEALNGSDTVMKRRQAHYADKYRNATRIDTLSNPPQRIFNEGKNSWAAIPQGSGNSILGT